MSNGSAPRWPKYRKLVRLIERGLPSTRAAVLSGLPEAALADPRVGRLVKIAEARFQYG